jgi:hypothetical protein
MTRAAASRLMSWLWPVRLASRPPGSMPATAPPRPAPWARCASQVGTCTECGVDPQPFLEARDRCRIFAAAEVQLRGHAGDRAGVEDDPGTGDRRLPELGDEQALNGPAAPHR